MLLLIGKSMTYLGIKQKSVIELDARSKERGVWTGHGPVITLQCSEQLLSSFSNFLVELNSLRITVWELLAS